MKILFVDLNAKVGIEDTFKPTTGDKSLTDIRKIMELRVINIST
jgi:hypothetical protein